MKDLVLFMLPNPALASPKMYPFLGVLYLSAVAKRAGYDVEVMDLRGENSESILRTIIPDAKFYGFSCTTPEIEFARTMAKLLPNDKIVGGPHPTLLPQDCIDDFDYVVISEGEEVLLDILKGGHRKGLVEAPRILDLDKIPPPDWMALKDPFSANLFLGERYGTGEKAATLIGARGCPFNCHFCGNMLRTPITYRSPVNIISEMASIQIIYNVHQFRFEDDNFTLHPDFEELCSLIKKFGFQFKCHTRSDCLTLEQAMILKDSGCVECCFGAESADDDVLKLNNKKETLENHVEAMDYLKRAKLISKVYWMTGLPGETDKTIELNKRFMKATKPDKWTISTFTPYPGCEIFLNPNKFGISILNTDWKTWWNFVIDEPDKHYEGREGYRHVLDGQTVEQMEARHNDFWNYLKSEEWK